MIAVKAPEPAVQNDIWRSAIYEGTVRHRRYAPKYHGFTYRVFMVYLDLQEMDKVFAQTPLWSNKGISLSWFRRKDFFDGKENDLYNAVASYVEEETGSRPNGAIRMLTNLRYFGFIINPITCYYCFDKTGEVLETVVAEVTNTPWGERCHYILDMRDHDNAPDVKNENLDEKNHTMKLSPITFEKAMHVSPFQPMNLVYQWRGKQPSKQLVIHLDVFAADDMSYKNTSEGELPSPVFDATLVLERQSLTKKTMNKKILCYPLMTVKVFASIYWQAIKLWWKKIPFYSAPQYRPVKNNK